MWLDKAAFRSYKDESYKDENIPFSRTFRLETKFITPKSISVKYTTGDQNSDLLGYDLSFNYHKDSNLDIELVVRVEKGFKRESSSYTISSNQTDVYYAIRKAIKSLYYDSKIVAARKSFIQ